MKIKELLETIERLKQFGITEDSEIKCYESFHTHKYAKSGDIIEVTSNGIHLQTATARLTIYHE